MTFAEEPLSTTHVAARIGCVRCHGLSAAHANDENIGATKPDVVIKGSKINTYCRTCHPKHDVAPAAVVTRWQTKKQLADLGGKASESPICASCHGTGLFAPKSYRHHDVKPEKLLGRWQKRLQLKLTKPASAEAATCTECHGEHKIARAADQK